MSDNGKLPQRASQDTYLTPRENVGVAFSFLLERDLGLDADENVTESRPWRFLDLGAGANGVWGEVARCLWPDAFIHGVEIQNVPKPAAYNWWSCVDMRSWAELYSGKKYDAVFGNPPYALAETAVRIGLDRVEDGGWVAMLLPITFLSSQGRRDGLFRQHPLTYYAQFSQRISWTKNGRTPPRDHALYVFVKGGSGPFQGYFLPNVRSVSERVEENIA